MKAVLRGWDVNLMMEYAKAFADNGKKTSMQRFMMIRIEVTGDEVCVRIMDVAKCSRLYFKALEGSEDGTALIQPVRPGFKYDDHITITSEDGCTVYAADSGDTMKVENITREEDWDQKIVDLIDVHLDNRGQSKWMKFNINYLYETFKAFRKNKDYKEVLVQIVPPYGGIRVAMGSADDKPSGIALVLPIKM